MTRADLHRGCIDKTSSAELSEAINSMYGWYQRAVRCYAYLNDVVLPNDVVWKGTLEQSALVNSALRHWRSRKPVHTPRPGVNACICTSKDAIYKSDGTSLMSHFLGGSRWFTRGWTLQELIAPSQLWFFDKNWRFIADRDDILIELEAITGVHKEAFWPGGNLHPRIGLSYFSVAQRMSWASRRQTTRDEDQAYCLMGIFGINMPLLYGEGKQAFIRLQQEIMKTTADPSILAWESLGPFVHAGNALLANSPACFTGDARNIVWDQKTVNTELRLTHQGLQIELSLYKPSIQFDDRYRIAALDCIFNEPGGHSHVVGLLLYATHRLNDLGLQLDQPSTTKIAFSDPTYMYKRGRPDRRLIRLPRARASTSQPQTKLLILWEEHNLRSVPPGREFKIKMEFLRKHENDPSQKWHVQAVYPRHQWFAIKWDLKLPKKPNSFAGIAVQSDRCGLVFVILGVTSYLNRTVNSTTMTYPIVNYWIVGQVQSKTDVEPPSQPTYEPLEHNQVPRARDRSVTSSKGCELAKVQNHLEELCRRASLFAAKDYFEQTKRRSNSHKSFRLSDADVLSATLEKAIWSRSNENMALHLGVESDARFVET